MLIVWVLTRCCGLTGRNKHSKQEPVLKAEVRVHFPKEDEMLPHPPAALPSVGLRAECP